MISISFAFSFPFSKHSTEIFITILFKYEWAFFWKTFQGFKSTFQKDSAWKKALLLFTWISPGNPYGLLLVKYWNRRGKQLLYPILTGLSLKYSHEIEMPKNTLLRLRESIKRHMAPIQALDSPQEQHGQTLPVSRTAHRISCLSYTVSQIPKNFILHPEYKVVWTFEAVSQSVREILGWWICTVMAFNNLLQFLISSNNIFSLFFPV